MPIHCIGTYNSIAHTYRIDKYFVDFDGKNFVDAVLLKILKLKAFPIIKLLMGTGTYIIVVTVSAKFRRMTILVWRDDVDDRRYTTDALSPPRWHGKHTHLSSLGIPARTQLNSVLFADHITFKNGYMKRVHTIQRMTNNNNNNKKSKFDTSDNPGLLS